MTRSLRNSRPLVFVTVGTDHHPFDRLTRWVDAWLSTVDGARVRCVVQGGTSRPSRLAEHAQYFSAREMASLLEKATAVVSHGGPATLAECGRLGKIPLVVPRRRHLGEHVNDHQVSFADRFSREGLVVVARSEGELMGLLDRAIKDPEAFRTQPREGVAREIVHRIGAQVEEVVAERTRKSGPHGKGADRLPLIFIGGWGRTGSTLLGRMLGRLPGFVLGGEVRQLWARALEDSACGCGSSFSSCGFWRAVGDRAFGGWDRVNLDRLLRLRTSLDRPWTLPLLVAAPRGISPGVREYVEALDRVYGAIAEVGGARVVIDTSKIPTHALLASKAPGIDLRVIHLVRDSRGVALSWQKQISRLNGSGAELMRRYGPLGTSGRYILYNAETHLLGWFGHPYVLARYEDLIEDPRGELRRVLRVVADEDADPVLPFLEDAAVRLEVDHTVDGNPMRFTRGTIPLNLDEAWRRELGRKERLLVSALTAPLLLRYSYRLQAGRRTARAR